MKELTIAPAQICPVPGHADANAEKMISFMQEAADKGAELIVFPECSLTGYAPDKAAWYALKLGSGPLRAVEEKALGLGISVCFGFMERFEDKLYISQELFCSGERTVYRKTHPGSREASVFEAGNDFPVAPSPVACGMQLCWESHIPEISAAYRKSGAELLLLPYASGMSGERCRDNWNVHLPARASDNGCFAAACNLLTTVSDPRGQATKAPATCGKTAKSSGSNAIRGGGLAVWDPKGRLIAQYFGTEETFITAKIGGELPRDRFLKEKQGLAEHDMRALSYFDLKRSELF